MAKYADYAEYVAKKLEARDLLEQLAEEASELSHAALKLIRAAEMNGNSTPVTKKDALNSIIEEFYDVYNAWYLLGIKDRQIFYGAEEYLTASLGYKKLGRWAKRLGYKED